MGADLTQDNEFYIVGPKNANDIHLVLDMPTDGHLGVSWMFL